nr:MAG TPA: hypothetical protein [Caudoviricetes sp.]
MKESNLRPFFHRELDCLTCCKRSSVNLLEPDQVLNFSN